MLANTAISALTGYFSDLLPLPGWVLQLIGVVFSLLVTTIFLTIIFRLLPNIKVRFVYILMGASVTAVLFSIGNYVIGRYLGRTSPGSAFGAAGSLAVILIWMYYSAHIVLFGAEVTRAYARRGTLRAAPESAGQCGPMESPRRRSPERARLPLGGIPPEARDDPPEGPEQSGLNRPASAQHPGQHASVHEVLHVDARVQTGPADQGDGRPRRLAASRTVTRPPGSEAGRSPRCPPVSDPSRPRLSTVTPGCQLQRQHAHPHQVAAVDALEALGDHRPHAQQRRALGRPVAGAAGAVLLAGEDHQRHRLGLVAHGRVVDGEQLARRDGGWSSRLRGPRP